MSVNADYEMSSGPQNALMDETISEDHLSSPSIRSEKCRYRKKTSQSRGSAKKPKVRDEISLRSEITKIHAIVAEEKSKNPTTFTESERENGDIVVGIDGMKTSIPRLCKLRQACNLQVRRDLRRLKCGKRTIIRTRIEYEKIVSALNNRIKYLDGKVTKNPKKRKTKNTKNKMQLGQIMTRTKEISAAKLKQKAAKTKQKTFKLRTNLSMNLRSSSVSEPKSQENQFDVSSDDSHMPNDLCSSSTEQEPPTVDEGEPTIISVKSLKNIDQIIQIKEEANFDEKMTFEPQDPQIMSPVYLNVRFSHSRQDIDVSDITNTEKYTEWHVIQCISKEANSEPDCHTLDNFTEKADNSHEKTSVCNNTIETDHLNVCNQGGVNTDPNSLGIDDFVEKVSDNLRQYFTEIDRLNSKYGIRDCKVLLGGQDLFGRLGVVSVKIPTVPKDGIDQAVKMTNQQPVPFQKHAKIFPTCTAKLSNSLSISNDCLEMDLPSARSQKHFNTTEVTHLSAAEMPNANIVEAHVLNSCSEVAKGLDNTGSRPQFEKHSTTREIAMNSDISEDLDIPDMQPPGSPKESPVFPSHFSKHCNEVLPDLEMASLQHAHFPKDFRTRDTTFVSDNSSESNNVGQGLGMTEMSEDEGSNTSASYCNGGDKRLEITKLQPDFDQGLGMTEISQDKQSNTSASDYLENCNEGDQSLEITTLQPVQSRNQSRTAEMSKTCTVDTLDSLKNSKNSGQGISSRTDQQKNSVNTTELLKTCISMASDVLKSCTDVGHDLEKMDITDLPLNQVQEHLKTSEMLKQCVATASNLLQNCSDADRGLNKTSLLSTPCQNLLTTTEMSKANSIMTSDGFKDSSGFDQDLRLTRSRRLLRKRKSLTTTKSHPSLDFKAPRVLGKHDLLRLGGNKRPAFLVPPHESGCARLHPYTRLYDGIDPV